MCDVDEGVAGVNWDAEAAFKLQVGRQLICKIPLATCPCGLGLDSEKTVNSSQVREEGLALGRHAQL